MNALDLTKLNISRVVVIDSATEEPISGLGSGSGGVVTTSNGTNANVASSATAVTVLAANSSRKSASVFNDSTAVLYLAEFPTSAATVSASNYTVQVAPGGLYTIAPEYNGVIQGIWASANGFARITEH